MKILNLPPTPNSNYVWKLSNRYNSVGAPLLDQFTVDLMFRGRTPEEDRIAWSTHVVLPASYTSYLYNPDFPDLEEVSAFDTFVNFISDHVREAYEPVRKRVEQEEYIFADHRTGPKIVINLNGT